MTESQIQQKIIIFERNNYSIKGESLLFAIPNGGSRNPIEAKNLKATGVMAGVSDLILIIKDKIYFIELKAQKGIQSESQKIFQSKVENLGFEYLIFYSLQNYQKWRQKLS
jgi:hypothetical protein